MESKIEIFDRIRCYVDGEIPAAMEYLVGCESMAAMMRFIYPEMADEQWRRMMLGCRSVDEFFDICFIPAARRIAEISTTGVTCDGLDRLSKEQGYLYLSNHRDISVDAGMLQLVMREHGFPAFEMAFGENLIFNEFFVHLIKSNKLFSVPRMTDLGKYARYAPVIAEYVRGHVAQDISVWIAQRNGRTKDGSDITEPALLKLFVLGCGGSQQQALSVMNIVPVAVSYEYEPCDMQKVRELFVKKRDGGYKKHPNEDFESVFTGLMQPKGRMHYTFCQPVTEEDVASVCRDGRVMFPELARLVDKRIFKGYHCFPSNYVAYDMLNGTDMSKNVCDTEYRTRFEQYLAEKIDALVGEFGEEHRSELYRMFLELYANPVINQVGVEGNF